MSVQTSIDCRLLLVAALWLAPLVAIAAPSTSGSPPACAARIKLCKDTLCFGSSSLDAARDSVSMPDIEIVDTTRNVCVHADLATGSGLDVADSLWVLSHNVRVDLPQGQLRAERADIQILKKRIATVSAQGSPVEVDLIRKAESGGGVVHGHADHINYDAPQSQLTMQGNSWISDGCNDVSSSEIVYDMATEHIHAHGGGDGQTLVHGTVRGRGTAPCSPHGGADKAASPAPTATPAPALAMPPAATPQSP